MTTRQQVALVAVVALIILLLVLLMPWRHAPQPLSDLQVAEGWLECIDCQGPFLDRLHESSSGDDTIVRFLRAALLQGPDSARRARHERDLLRTWADDSLYRLRLSLGQEGTPLPGPDKTAFLERYRQGFDAKWRGRAAIALGVIRSDTALAALDSALLVPAADRGDSIVSRWVARARADTGRKALDHWPPAKTKEDSTPGAKTKEDSTPGR